MRLSHVPLRVVTGAFILHSGWQKWHGDEKTAEGVHGMATGAYPFLENVPAARFLRMLSIGEMTVGTLLLAPLVPTFVAGAALSGFSTALLGMYARIPGMRQPESIWPTQQGIALSKDSWMLGIGLSLLVDA
ncbi:MAG: hypothetical protein ACXVIH_08935 [Ilumatobacteraceae bacterium]